MHDSLDGQSLDEPEGHAFRHLLFASSRSNPQKNVAVSSSGSGRPTQVVYSKQLNPFGHIALLPDGQGYSHEAVASSKELPQ
jgi:hypothetical protein